MRTRYEWPTGLARPLGTRPLLESWNARSDPAQVRLRSYRERIGEVAREPVALVRGPLAVALEIALDKAGDLDNYLPPVAAALKELAPVSFWALKRVGGESTLTLAEARPAFGHSAESGWAEVEARTTASATTTAWKEQVAAQAGRQESAGRRGPMEVEVSFFVSPQRNWTTLWKPALDSLGGILGNDSDRRWRPRDDRIVHLGLHRFVVPDLGHDVRLLVWWRDV